MPTVAVHGVGAVDLSQLNVSGVPNGTYVQTTAGDFYQLAASTAPLSTVYPIPLPPQPSIIGPARAAKDANNSWEVYGQPDFPRQLSVTASGTGWDGGAIWFQGVDVNGQPISEYVGVPDPSILPDAGLVAYTRQIFARVTASPQKATAGSTATTVSLGTGPLVATFPPPAVVAVRDRASFRWLYANDQILATALPRVQLFDFATGTYIPGTAAVLQDLVDSRNAVLRRVVDCLREAGIATNSDVDDWYRSSQR